MQVALEEAMVSNHGSEPWPPVPAQVVVSGFINEFGLYLAATKAG